MPEGPEVAIIKDGLNQLLSNTYLVELNFEEYKSRYQIKKPNGYLHFEEKLHNKKHLKIIDVKCKGKFIYFVLENETYIYNTLGMSGGWYHTKKPHIVCQLNYKINKDDTNIKSVYFVDQRHFGTFKFVHSKEELNKKLSQIGKDLLNSNITYKEFIETYRKKNNKKIDIVINDQKIFSGIGNYLKAEVLYQAEISPHALIKDIGDDKLKELLDIIKDKINESYKLGGASVQHYTDLEDNKGKYHNFFKVYKKKIDPLGNKVIAERVSKPNDNKSQQTYWVPSVQKEKFN